MVLFKDNTEFQKEWMQAEIALINILRNHLMIEVINLSRDKIRELTKQTFYELRKEALTGSDMTQRDKNITKINPQG